VASKPDSQEVCFVTNGTYADFIEKATDAELPGEGFFIDEAGNILGKHKGIIRYTVGQRKGLGLALGAPAYVKEIRAEKNEVVLGDAQSLYCDALLCRDVNFLSIPGLAEGETLPCTVKIRYHHGGQSASVSMRTDGRAAVSFDAPVRAPAPGQSAVFYDKEERVIGGGIIDEVSPSV
jgi:tRNA-specific 2-thiouridylase